MFWTYQLWSTRVDSYVNHVRLIYQVWLVKILVHLYNLSRKPVIPFTHSVDTQFDHLSRGLSSLKAVQ